jgi:putative transposase
MHEYLHAPIELACELVDLPRSTYYYKNHKPDESQLEQDMEQVVGQFPLYGTRRVAHQLRRPPYDYQINRKRAQRIMRQRHWLRPVRRKGYRTTRSDHDYPRYANLVKDLVVTHPEQVWVVEIV